MQIFDLPKDINKSGSGTHLVALSSEAAETILSQIKSPPTFLATTSSRFGQTKKLCNQKDFTHPTEYDPPKFKKKDAEGIFPVTPPPNIAPGIFLS